MSKRDEHGTITVMTVGFLVFLGLLVVVVVNASDAFLQRRELDNLADGAALAAVDGLDRDAFYTGGDVAVDAEQARRLVATYVAGADARVVSVRTTDDQVLVRLERSVRLALRPPGLPSTTTVVSEATGQLRVAPP
jgi:Flp pilus assembly protein TadG